MIWNQKAKLLRKVSGSEIEQTLLKALKVLKLFSIPHFVCGGFAVQEHGYPRFTIDVDLVVPDPAYAIEKLGMNGFRARAGAKMTVTDRQTGVEVDLLPAGGSVVAGQVVFPTPTVVSDKPQFLTLEDLISLKLSSYMGSPTGRAQDFADVVKLVEYNRPSKDLAVQPEVKGLYHTILENLRKEKRL